MAETGKRVTAPEVAKELELLKARVIAIEAAAQEVRVAQKETHDMVLTIHDALMVPEPGQDKGLLHRMAKVSDAIESGERVAGWAVKIASVLAAIGVIAASIKVGIWPEVK